jgi:carboxypeptidase C (cathepsin A)
MRKTDVRVLLPFRRPVSRSRARFPWLFLLSIISGVAVPQVGTAAAPAPATATAVDPAASAAETQVVTKHQLRLAGHETTYEATGLAQFTGLDPTEILRHNLRLGAGYFRRTLLKDSGMMVGGLDSRVAGAFVDASGMASSFDPAMAGISGAFIAAFEGYVRRDLGFRSDLDYRAEVEGLDNRWDWHHRAPSGHRLTTVDVALDLAHMLLPEALRRNIEFGYYSGGHMIYLDSAARISLKRDLDRFYDAASPSPFQ